MTAVAFVSVAGLSRNFSIADRHIHALADVSLDVASGEKVAVVGPSGSGKTTLLALIGLLDKPSSGSYSFDGADTTKLNDVELAALRARDIGFIFQAYNLIPQLTVVENISLSLEYRGIPFHDVREHAISAAEAVGLGGRLHHKPSQLSGGEQQRVAIARAWVGKPRLLIADEPTGNLDSVNSAAIMDLILRLNEAGSTVVMVTHNRELCNSFDRVVEMRDGRVCH